MTNLLEIKELRVAVDGQDGAGASAKYTTIILGSAGATIDTGGAVYLNADDTSAELAHRGVCTGGRMYQRGLLIGQASAQGVCQAGRPQEYAGVGSPNGVAGRGELCQACQIG
ncbi:MAG: hypothetical protein AB1801_15225 [Chloroflexota bacterium]